MLDGNVRHKTKPVGERTAVTTHGFTLVELLVVVSIIALLISILLPSLRKAREQAKVAVCMNNQRQLALATNAYLTEGDGRTPAGFYNNAGGISPKGQNKPVGEILPDGTQVWDSIGGLLRKYVGANPEKIYRCPSAAGSRDDSFEISGKNPFSGREPDDIFKPNYFYMCTAQWITLGSNDYWYPQVWDVRNVANIPGNWLRTPAAVVAWVDESTSHHTNSTDIYGRNADGFLRVKDISNFGYLDGHVETKRFENLRGYLKSLSAPIPQTQWGINFRKHPHWALANTFPDE